MNNINSVIISGRITKDLDERSWGYIANGTAKANVRIAVNRSKQVNEQWVDDVSYFDVVIWGKRAENLKPYLTKGRKITVAGYLKQDRWQGQNGENKSRICIIAESVELGDEPKGQQGTFQSVNYGGQNNQQNNGYQQNNPQNNGYQNNGSYSDFPEDIPFDN